MRFLRKLFIYGLCFQLSCSSFNAQAKDLIRGMKAADYFPEPVQIELVKAAEKGDISGIDKAIARGAEVNKEGKEQITPLVWVLGKQNKAGFQRLLEKGASTDFRTTKMGPANTEISAMKLAASAEDSDYLRLLLKHGGNPNATVSTVSNETVLFTAIHNHRYENVKLLLAEGANINYRDKSGTTPIMLANSTTQFDIVFFLMEVGADLSIRQSMIGPDGKTYQGWTLTEQIKQFADRSIILLNKEKEQRVWYNKVIAELKRRGLY